MGMHYVYSCVCTYVQYYECMCMYTHTHTHTLYYTHATYAHTYIYVLLVMCEFVRTYVCIIFFSDEEHVVESLPRNVPEDARAYLYSSWKNEFCPVAAPLLDRVKQHHTSLVPL